MPNAYQVGVGGFVVVSLYIIIFHFLSRMLAAKLANANNSTLSGLGAAMGAII